jgi:hypothetical protein
VEHAEAKTIAEGNTGSTGNPRQGGLEEHNETVAPRFARRGKNPDPWSGETREIRDVVKDRFIPDNFLISVQIFNPRVHGG